MKSNTIMWYWTVACFLLVQPSFYHTQGNKQPINVYEPISENCTDPNAEWRFDNANCTLTCTKKSIFSNNPVNCFEQHILKADCYCKQNFVLDTSTNNCVSPEKCPCDTKANQISRYSNKCANTCATFHTLTNCPGELTQDCWCFDTYCQNDQGKCIEKE